MKPKPFSIGVEIQRAMREAHDQGQCFTACVFCWQRETDDAMARSPLLKALRGGDSVPVGLNAPVTYTRGPK